MTGESSFLDGEHLVLPILQLSLNVLPGELVPLHIFEERYKKLIEHCLGEGESEDPQYNLKPFGILLAGTKHAEFGCAVHVEAVLKSYKDGRADILCRASRVFQLLQILVDGDFPRAHVRWVESDMDSPNELREEVLELAQKYFLQLQTEQPLPSSDEVSSFSIATMLRLDLFERQELLRLRAEKDRLAKLRSFIHFRAELLKRGGPDAVHSLYTD